MLLVYPHLEPISLNQLHLFQSTFLYLVVLNQSRIELFFIIVDFFSQREQ